MIVWIPDCKAARRNTLPMLGRYESRCPILNAMVSSKLLACRSTQAVRSKLRPFCKHNLIAQLGVSRQLPHHGWGVPQMPEIVSFSVDDTHEVHVRDLDGTTSCWQLRAYTKLEWAEMCASHR